MTVLLGGAARSTTVTDGDGKYSFSGLASGTYTITPTQGGYTCSPARATVTLNGTSEAVVPDFSARFVASIWAVGGDGGSTVLRWDGHTWSVVASGPPAC